MNLELQDGNLNLSLEDFLQQRFKELKIEPTREMKMMMTEAVIEIDTFLRKHGIFRENQELFVSEDVDQSRLINIKGLRSHP